MKGVLVISFLVSIVARHASALTCNEYTCIGSDCTSAATCESGSGSCETLKYSINGLEGETYSCSVSDICMPVLRNSSAGITSRTCCSTDLCNDGSNRPLEENLAYCYSATCYGKGCLSGMINYIDTRDVGTFCAASEEGCQTMMTRTSNPSTGQITVLETTGCSFTACKPSAVIIDGLQSKSYCCNERLCNDGGEMVLDPNKEYCYVYNCVSSPSLACVSVSEAAEQGQTSFCEKTDTRCISISTISDSSTTISSNCVSHTGLSECIAASVTFDGSQTTIRCCNTDRCNDGEEAPDPNKKYCYVYTCLSSNCSSIPEAIAQGPTSLCEQSDKGCFTSSILHSTDSDIVNIGCVGATGSGTPTCTPVSYVTDQTETSVTCCNSDKCNDGTEDPGDVTVSPDKKYCYVYNCISSTCLTIQEATEKGQTTLCEQSDKGCMIISIISSRSASIISGCVGITPGMDTCTPASVTMDDTETTVTCCNSNQCYNGTVDSGGVTVIPDKKYCYVYNCIAASTCLTIQEAIEQEQTTLCEQSDKGCTIISIISSDSASIISGCVGITTGKDTCTPASVTMGDLETTTTCCNSNQCNNGTVDSGGVTVIPDKNYCYVYNCVSSTCLSVSEAIDQGQTTLCEQSGKGCFVSSSISSDSSTVASGCVGVTPGVDNCIAGSSVTGDSQTTVTCCNANQCNNVSAASGNGTVDDEKDYCHVYTCVSSSTTCMSLSEAIQKGQTTKCEKPDKGCFAMKSSTTTIMAGCIGDAYGMTECPTASHSGGKEVVCCKEDGCNNFTSASSPLFSQSVAGLLLVALLLRWTLVAL